MGLLERLPPFLQESATLGIFFEGLQAGMNAIDKGGEEFAENLFIDTAGDYGLKQWEREYGIGPKAEATLEDRRSTLKAKMRGQGTATKSMIEAMAAAFSNGEVEVIEDNGNSRFFIKFVGTMGTPPNMKDLTEAIETAKPAHLAFEYVYIFYQNGQLKEHTHQSLVVYTHKQIREGAFDND